MDKFVINGGKALHGEVRISGAKNAAVAILPAVMLADSPCIIENLPQISDVSAILNVMRELGATVRLINKTSVEIDPRHINSFVVSNLNKLGLQTSFKSFAVSSFLFLISIISSDKNFYIVILYQTNK